jgi:hypothetical protein
MRNISYTSKNLTQYKFSDTFGAGFNLSFGGGAGYSASGNVNAAVDVPTVASVDVSASLATGVDISAKVSVKASATYLIMGTDGASFNDYISYTTADYDIWRYPIIGSAYPESDYPDTPLEDRTTYVQWVVPTKQQKSGGSPYNLDIFYTPTHEEGNLFSYPVKKENIKGHNAKHTIPLNTGNSYSPSDTTTSAQQFSISESLGVDGSLELKANLTGSASVSGKAAVPGIAKISGSLTASLKASLEASVGANLTLDRSDKFTTKVDGASFTYPVSTAPYTATPLAFSEGLTGTVHYAYLSQLEVSRSDAGDGLWRANSVYALYPDPALNLPNKYYPKNPGDSNKAPIITPQSQSTATKLRGLSITDTEGSAVGYNLARGKSYVITVPITNYSLKDMAGPVDVAFCYTLDSVDVDGNPQDALHEIGRGKVKLPGWNKDDTHRADVSCTWTVPSSLDGGYRLYIRIDPDNTLEEVHEDWSGSFDRSVEPAAYIAGSGDPSGNNTGYVMIGIMDEDMLDTFDKSLKSLGTAKAGAAKAAAEARGVSVRLTDVTPDKIRKALSAGENIRVEGYVEYTGDKRLTNVHVIIDEDTADGNKSVQRLADRYFPLVDPGDRNDFSFILEPARLAGNSFLVYVRGDNFGSRTIPLDVIVHNINSDDDDGYGSGGSGCDAGFGALGIALLFAATRKREQVSK